VPHLNEAIAFSKDAPEYVRAAFVRQSARRLPLPDGTELYKFTAFDFYPVGRDGKGQAGAAVSPWWCLVDPLPGTDDKGLDGLVAAAKAAGVPTVEYAREVLAVMFGWNALASSQLGMAKVLMIRLTKPVYGFYGQCQRMPNDQAPLHKAPAKARPSLTGGAYQLWIPNLTAEHFVATGTHLIP
jgi:hypothetical protein